MKNEETLWKNKTVNDQLTDDNGRDASQFKCYEGQSVLVKIFGNNDRLTTAQRS